MAALPDPDQKLLAAETGESTLSDVSVESEPEQGVTASRRIGRQAALWLSVAWLVAIIFCAIFATVLPLPSPNEVGVAAPGAGPSGAHWLGADKLGRDELSRLIYAARVSFIVGFGATAIALPGGAIVGLIAGYFRGWIDAVLAVCIDTLLAFPALVFSLAVVTFVGPSLPVVTVTLGIFGIATAARVVRGATIRASQPDYVLAARLLGARSRRIIFRELVPFVLVPVLAFGALSVAFVMIVEAGLSFFGVDVRPPTPSWGNMINASVDVMGDHPLLLVWPALFLFLSVVALNFVGDFIQSRYDVREGRL